MYVGDREVHLYEAFWADILKGTAVEDSFNISMIEEAAWFPQINQDVGLWPRGIYNKSRILWHKIQLQIVLFAVIFLDALIPSCIRKSILDNIAADVWNYVYSLAGAFSPHSSVGDAAERIVTRVRECVAQIQADGCKCWRVGRQYKA